jgi:hypothetical protein
MSESQVDYEALQEEAREVFEIAAERKASDNDVGFFAYGDAPAAIGGGVGGFCWFEKESDLLEFLKKYSLFIYPPRSDLDFDTILNSVSVVVEEYRNGNSDKVKFLSELNTSLRHSVQFRWVGTFADLKNGGDEFAREVLEDFREDEDVVPVEQEEEEDFRDHLSLFGI